jgi:hypothetical protein
MSAKPEAPRGRLRTCTSERIIVGCLTSIQAFITVVQSHRNGQTLSGSPQQEVRPAVVVMWDEAHQFTYAQSLVVLQGGVQLSEKLLQGFGVAVCSHSERVG